MWFFVLYPYVELTFRLRNALFVELSPQIETVT